MVAISTHDHHQRFRSKKRSSMKAHHVSGGPISRTSCTKGCSNADTINKNWHGMRCVSTYIYICVYIYVYIYISIYTHVYMQMCIYIVFSLCLSVYLYVCMHACINKYIIRITRIHNQVTALRSKLDTTKPQRVNFSHPGRDGKNGMFYTCSKHPH